MCIGGYLGPDLYDLISSKSKLVKSNKYLLLPVNETILYILPNDQVSIRMLIRLSSQNPPEIINRKYFVVVEENGPRKEGKIEGERVFHVAEKKKVSILLDIFS